MIRNFTLDFWQDEGWYVGKLREVPGVFSQGESLEALKENIQDAYDLMMQETMQIPVENFNSNRTDNGYSLKRKDFIKRLAEQECYLKRHGRKHDILY